MHSPQGSCSRRGRGELNGRESREVCKYGGHSGEGGRTEGRGRPTCCHCGDEGCVQRNC